MRLIDADVLLDNIRRDSKKAIDEGDKVGSFWLGYAAGLVIKQPTIQSALDPETLIRTIETGITATNSNDAYSLGMRNGMRWCKSLIDGAEPKFEDDVMSVDDGKEFPTIQPEKAQLSKEGTISDTISRQAAIDAVDKYDFNIPEYMEGFVTKLRDAMKEDLREDIAALPTVQPEVLACGNGELVAQPEAHEGHWILYDKRFPWRTWYKCSECGNYLDFAGVNGGRAEPHFCPNCGAKMTTSK